MMLAEVLQERDVDEGRSGASAVGKGLLVLQGFDSPQASRGVTELADELELSKATVHRVLQELCAAGFVVRLPNNRYQIGLRMFELGTLVHRQMSLRNTAAPHLHELYETTGGSIYLSVLDGLSIVHLERLPARRGPAIPARLGGRWPLHCTSLGKVLLAYSAGSLVARYLRRPLTPLTRHSITTPERLHAELRRVRSLGYGTTVQESVEGVYGVAAPVFDRADNVVAALSVAGADQRLLRFAPRVTDAGRRISADLVQAHFPTAPARTLESAPPA